MQRKARQIDAWGGSFGTLRSSGGAPEDGRLFSAPRPACQTASVPVALSSRALSHNFLSAEVMVAP